MLNFTKLLSTAVFCALPLTAIAENKDWTFEVTPYAWLSGIDADITAGDRTANMDAGFDDLVDKVDLAGSLLGIAQYKDIIFYGQFDYAGLSEDGTLPAFDNRKVGVESDMTIMAAAVGYQFDGFVKNSTIDLLLGARYSNFDNSINTDGIEISREADLYDGIVMLRPSFVLSEKWRFNPTMSIGTGDTDLTWELHPQFQYAITQALNARFGYRRLHYDFENDKNAEFDGALHGLTLGLGMRF